MDSDAEIRKRAITAMKAVTAGAILAAGVACSSDGETPDAGWELTEDVGQDSADDTGSDTSGVDTGPDAITQDTGSECNDQESTGYCPEGCGVDDDIDCCTESSTEMCWSSWEEGFGCTTICEGPFVPPEMPS